MKINLFDLADQIANEINTQDFSSVYDESFTAKVDVPITTELEKMIGLNVNVIPSSKETTVETRRSTYDQGTIDIAVQKHIGKNRKIDAVRQLTKLCDAISDQMKFNSYNGASFLNISIDPIYAQAHMDINVFTSIISITYHIGECNAA